MKNKANIFKKFFFSIYSLASDLLVSLIRKKLIKYYDKSNAKSLRSVAPGRYSLVIGEPCPIILIRRKLMSLILVGSSVFKIIHTTL